MNPSDTTYFIAKETTGGTIVANPVWTSFPYIPGTMPDFSANMVTSNVLQANRASAGARKAGFKVGGGLKTHLRRGNHVEYLMESALSGVFTANVLKAGNTDTYISIEKQMKESGTTYYHRFLGCQASDMTLTCDASSNAEISYSIIGMNRATDIIPVTGTPTYPAVTMGQSLMGLDVNTFTVAGLTAVFRTLQLQVSHNREAQDQFGSPSARAVGTSGFRTVNLKAQLYRADLSPDTLLALSNTPIAVSFVVGAGTGNVFTFALPAANFDVPKDVEDNSKALVEINFVGSYDSTSGTDISITRS